MRRRETALPFHTSIPELLVRVPVVLLSLTIHEFMHALAAYKCGDDTAYQAGRLTLNPLVHLDLIGTLALMFAPIGWAKPVPVNASNLDYQTRRRDEVLISGAGIAANLGLAVVLGLAARALLWAGLAPQAHAAAILWRMMGAAILVNFGLGIFNLLPLFPLDGSHILKNLLPLNAAIRFAGFSRYGPYLLMGVVVLNMTTGFLGLAIVSVVLPVTGLDAFQYLYAPLGG